MGSEMCIRDRPRGLRCRGTPPLVRAPDLHFQIGWCDFVAKFPGKAPCVWQKGPVFENSFRVALLSPANLFTQVLLIRKINCDEISTGFFISVKNDRDLKTGKRT